jgi:hypothetical protein
MLSKIKSALKNPVMYVGLVVGIIVALAYGRFIRPTVQPLANALPGSDAKSGS